ncbi:MAG: hypothetical protein U9R28_09980 [Pseudomonadota bacterium]|nr:hypothetical protein [Pseudomonadota bacterium]
MTSSITRQAYIRKKAPLTAAIPNFVLKKLFASTLVISSSILVSACGGGGGSSSESGTDGTKSLVKQEMLTVAVFEGETKSVNLLEEGCNDSVTSNLTYNDSQTLPENYNFTDNVLTIDLTTTNIDDGADTTDLFELTCSTHVTSKKGNLSVTKQDLDSDALMTHVIDLPIAITTREHFAGSITLTDTDMPDSGVLNDRYTFDIIDTSNESSVFNGTMTTLTDDSESSRIYSISIDVDHSDSPIDAGSYRFQTQAITPVITGYENEQSYE